MDKFRVHLGDEEHDVEVEGDVVRVDGQELRVLPGPCETDIEVLSGAERWRLVPLPDIENEVRLLVDGRCLRGRVESSRDRLLARAGRSASSEGPERVHCEIPGIVREVFCRVGDRVEAGDALFTLEAMKMQNEVLAGRGGNIVELHAKEGQTLAAGALLAVIR